MKNKFKFLTLFSFLALVITGCNEASLPFSGGSGDIDTPWKDFTYPMTSFSVLPNEESMTISRGESHSYHYEYAPEYAKESQLKWETSNDEVLAVDGNTITGLAEGSAVVTVSTTEPGGFSPVQLRVNVDVPIKSYSIDNIVMDYNEELKISPVFVPFDTSYQYLEYSFEDETQDIIEINNGVITSFEKSGTVTVIAKNAKLAGTDKETVTFTVTVETIEVETVNITLSKNEIEVGNSAVAYATVTPNNASAYVKHGMKYATTTPDIISINENTGDITALAEGEGHIHVEIGNGVYGDAKIDVYEVKATAIILCDSEGKEITDTIELNNTTAQTATVGYVYTLDRPEATTPTNPNAAFSSSDPSVATINSQGVITMVSTGTTTITVEDENYDVSDSVTVNVTVTCVSLTVNAESTSLYVGQSTTISVTTNPSVLTDDSVTYSLNAGEPACATLVQESGSKVATLTAIGEGTAIVTATVNGITNTVSVTCSIDHTFHENTPYVVGINAYNTGTSTPCGDMGSWLDAALAGVMSEEIPDPYAFYQRKITINFAKDDVWKVRFGVDGWADVQEYGVEPQGGKYEIDELGSVISWSNDGDMTVLTEVTDTGTNRNIKVNKPGSYDIYYKIYHRSAEEGGGDWWQISVVHTPTISFSDEKVNLDIGAEHAETVTVENYDTDFTILNDYDADLITVERQGSTNAIKITGLAYGTTVITAKDNSNKTATCEVTVSKVFEVDTPYIVGNRDYSSGTATGTDPSWTDASKAFKMTQVVTPGGDDPENLDYQRKATVTFEQNDKWLIRFGPEDSGWRNVQYNDEDLQYHGQYDTQNNSDFGYENKPMTVYTNPADQTRNIVVNEPGRYDIYYKIYDLGKENEWWSIYIMKTPVITVDKAEVTIDKLASTTVKVSNAVGEVTVTYDETYLTVTPGNDGTYTITGVEYTSAPVTVTFKDELNFTATCNVTVSVPFEEGKPYAVGSADFSSGISSGDIASWNDANKANKLASVSPDPKDASMKEQYHAVIKFNANDEWKIRVGDLWIGDTEHISGEYEIDKNGSAITTVGTLMGVMPNGNIIVNTPGTYDIYVKVYTRSGDTDWWSVWVGQHAVSFEKSSVDVVCNEQMGVKLNGAIGDVNYSVDPATGLTIVTESCTNTVCTFKASTTVGTYTITATDSYGNKATLTVVVHETKPVTIPVTAKVSNDQKWAYGDQSIPIFAWYWGTGNSGAWMKIDYIAGGDSISFELPEGTTGFLLVRCSSSTKTPDWSVGGDNPGRIYNKTGDVNLVSGTVNYNVSFSDYYPS